MVICHIQIEIFREVLVNYMDLDHSTSSDCMSGHLKYECHSISHEFFHLTPQLFQIFN
jgi:hypothetical protein